MKDRNVFKTSTAKHVTDDEVFDFIDGGEVPADFQEIFEYTEGELAISLRKGVDSTSSKVNETGSDKVKPEETYPGTEDAVFEYLDRFPSSGS
jgi:hypothetical protein